MIKIDDAGTGSLFGVPVIVGYREENEKVISYEYKDRGIVEIGMDIIKFLNPYKEEPILVCRGNIFIAFRDLLKSKGYNVIACEIDGKFQDIAEDVFMEQLYSIGFSREIVLHGKDYIRLNNELLDNLYTNPNLLNHIRKRAYKVASIKEVLRKIDRLTNEFPNLYSMMLGSK